MATRAGRPADAVVYLRQPIDLWEGYRDMAQEDSGFDPIDNEPAFEKRVGGGQAHSGSR